MIARLEEVKNLMGEGAKQLTPAIVLIQSVSLVVPDLIVVTIKIEADIDKILSVVVPQSHVGDALYLT